MENNLIAGVFTPDRMAALQMISSQLATSLENMKLIEERENAVKLETEMKIAEEIQLSLLPENPEINGYEITAYMKPAENVGGDYYDIINNKENDWVIIGDVSGHGVSAGMLMVMVQSSIMGFLNEDPLMRPSELLKKVNNVISTNIKKMKNDKYITITALCIENNGRITLSGLHQTILIYRSSVGKTEQIETDGIWLSPWQMFSNSDFNSEIHLNTGDKIMLYTDGITEAWLKGSIKGIRDPKSDIFGLEKLQEIFEKNGSLSNDKIRDEILSELQNYETNDDITMMILEKNRA